MRPEEASPVETGSTAPEHGVDAPDAIAVLAHDLAQPLSSIASYARGCVHRLKSADCRAEELLPAMERILSEVTRAAGLVQRLRELPRDSSDSSSETVAAQQQRGNAAK